MKKIYLTFLIAAFASAAWAQDTPKKPSFAGFVSNGFWDNWEISVGAGAGTAFSNGSNLKSFGDRIGFEGNFSLTKWVHPVVGLRAQLQGGWFNNYDPEKGKMDWPYMFVHTDVMLNVSNWIGGYREDRAWYAVPFVGFGYMASNFTDKSQRDFGASTNQELAFTYGLLSKFRLSPAFDFNIELKGLLAKSELCPAQMNGQYLLGFSATAGLTYRFNKRNWDKAYTQEEIDGYLAAIDALESGLADAHRNEGKLAERLAAQKAATDQAMKDNEALRNELAKKQDKVISSTAIFFNFDSAKLLDRAKASLQILQETINAAPKSQVFTLVGHADVKTGTAEYNQKLSERRAKAVYDYLVEQGVNPDQLTWKGVGSTQNIFPINGTNRVVIVK